MRSLQPPKSQEVTIEISDAVPTDAEIEADLKGLMNMTAISMETAGQLRRIGMHVHRQGMIETQRGTLYVTQGWVLGMCRDLYKLATKKVNGKSDDGSDVNTDEICKLADCLGKLAGKQAELSHAMASHEPVKAVVKDAPPAPLATFPAGAILFSPNSHAHFHQTPPPEKTVANPPDEA